MTTLDDVGAGSTEAPEGAGGADPVARTRLSPEDRRAAVIDATIPLLVEHGLGLTTRQIADAAGVAEGTLFRVFDDKKALVIAAIARAMDPDPVIAALGAVDGERALDDVLAELVDVLATRSAGIRSVMGVAHELRRASAEDPHTGLIRDPDALSRHEDVDRPGSLAHAAHQLRSRAGRAPERIVGALADALTPHRAELRRDPEVCARILFSIVTSSFHEPLSATEQLTGREVVEVFLDGMRARPATQTLSPDTPEAPC
ncbi:TetR/AcrR family transcriptional regulator [Actinotalea sp. M2MS4P-6]|uniref:TetR/AcrR family transcriptional regulator n=1 Tax=Actinotalea sp. M2MS4P-6 TaxID=2983762 RepID=UPI0021E4E497|nr:TetR/AcrR family transcriptional regulator [Actinotalea sp. M2MS4P-6]MCV2393327.1 TetR/AcrR family transcriptional regulator [Actinotalea sp. M2MS4P-6]